MGGVLISVFAPQGKLGPLGVKGLLGIKGPPVSEGLVQKCNQCLREMVTKCDAARVIRGHRGSEEPLDHR